MQAPIKWLKDYVDFNETPEVLADKLTMAGIPVETIAYLGQNIENVVTGRITDIQSHPNADKLSVCQVDAGKEKLTIVTGAGNISLGDIIPVALVGAKLPNGMKIKASKLRGILSYGMMCSAAELDLDAKTLSSRDKEGIYILPADTPLGADIRTILGLDDVVLEFELTANRADCFSMVGLAREIAVLTGGSVKKPMLNLRETGEKKTNDLVDVTIDAPDLCSRFTGRILTEVKVGPSPEWLKHRLQSAGIRSINNVVDVTNFVMLELGFPMHAYDYNLLSRHSITVRKALPGERLTTLDGVKRELTAEMLVIADAVQAVGIAGVMGGLATEVTANTQTVLLEAAAFNGASIRRTSRALGLRSEASGRFERGVDTANTVRALDRAAKLLEDMGAGKVCPGIIDNYPDLCLPTQIHFAPEQINTYLGADIPAATMLQILKSLEFEVAAKGKEVTVTIPTWRGDVSGPADIAEEVSRIYGYDKIPSHVPNGDMLQGRQSATQSIVDKIKDVLTAIGFSEVVSFSFTHLDTLDKLNIPQTDDRRTAIPILNPITDDFPLLRTTLLGGIMETIVRNFSRKNDSMKIFELGAVYLPQALPLEDWPEEPLMLCGALTGKKNEISWNQSTESVDFYDAKGAVEVLLERLGVTDYTVAAAAHPSLHPGKTAAFRKEDQIIATVGEVHPQVLQAFNMSHPVYIFELRIQDLIRQAEPQISYQPLPKFPAIGRDLAIILPREVEGERVSQAITDSAGELLSEVRLFDVYTGEQVPAGFRSMAFSLTFRSPDRTLTDVEVDEHYGNIVACLEKTFKAKQR
ncbi:MAG: phenylalanine--tRNA ligase subunit beta [Veillonellales bacterium]